MKVVEKIEIQDNREEILPDFAREFPCITTCANLDQYINRILPWHWHNAVELFYVESGSLDYYTPGGSATLPAGSGGFVNSGVLHRTVHQRTGIANVQLLHLFDPDFIGQPGSRIHTKYVQPVVTNPNFHFLPILPDSPDNIRLLESLRATFDLRPGEPGYELKLREKLSLLWLEIFRRAEPYLEGKAHADQPSLRVKQMMAYIHENYSGPISVQDLAAVCNCSQRECYRIFQSCLRMTPNEYIQSYRLQMACRMLLTGKEAAGSIAFACGFSCGSYFGKVFRETFGCTPLEYRRKGLRQA